MNEGPVEYRKVGLFMWAGIICMPLIFSWPTFREGYSPTVRLAATLMLLFVLYVIFIASNLADGR